VEVAERVESPGQVGPQLLQLLLDAVRFFHFSCPENGSCVVSGFCSNNDMCRLELCDAGVRSAVVALMLLQLVHGPEPHSNRGDDAA